MREHTAGEPQKPKAEILVVDDQPEITELVADTLCEEGYVVRAAHDGASALAAIRQRRPDLLILDLAMPILGGDQVLQCLRSEGAADLPVILMTAERAPERYRCLGADEIMRKPFDIAAMVRAVERFLGAVRPRLAPPRPIPAEGGLGAALQRVAPLRVIPAEGELRA